MNMRQDPRLALIDMYQRKTLGIGAELFPGFMISVFLDVEK
jgi:hypothetical protein